MISDRALRLAIVVAVLAAAWYAGRAGFALAIAVAIVGLAAAYWRTLLGIPVAVAMAAAAMYVPGLAVVATIIAALLGIISVFVKFAFDLGPMPESTVTPGSGFFGSGDIGGGGNDCGGFGGGG